MEVLVETLKVEEQGKLNQNNYNTFINKIGGDIVTTILVDLHGGLASGGAANDIIGTDGGTANAYIAELTSAVNGIPYKLEFICLEVPTGGDPDINLVCSATGTSAENAAVTSGTVLFNNGDLTLGLHNEADAGSTLAALSKKYLYLTCGDATDAAYTAGKLVIKIHGAAFDFDNGELIGWGASPTSQNRRLISDLQTCKRSP